MPTETERKYWLLKTEPTTFSMDDLMKAPKKTTSWDGVRNFQARNMLRDQMKKGDLAFIYHSSADPTGIAGIAEIVRSGYPDATQFDPKDDHFDPKSSKESPNWYVVDVKGLEKLPKMVTLERMRSMKSLEGMVLLKKGSRLSVQPVSAAEWKAIIDEAKG